MHFDTFSLLSQTPGKFLTGALSKTQKVLVSASQKPVALHARELEKRWRNIDIIPTVCDILLGLLFILFHCECCILCSGSDGCICFRRL